MLIGLRGKDEFNIIIYDMYGNDVFSSNDPDFKWYGEQRDGSVKEGMYVYVISAVGVDGQPLNKQGTITLSK